MLPLLLQPLATSRLRRPRIPALDLSPTLNRSLTTPRRRSPRLKTARVRQRWMMANRRSTLGLLPMSNQTRPCRRLLQASRVLKAWATGRRASLMGVNQSRETWIRMKKVIRAISLSMKACLRHRAPDPSRRHEILCKVMRALVRVRHRARALLRSTIPFPRSVMPALVTARPPRPATHDHCTALLQVRILRIVSLRQTARRALKATTRCRWSQGIPGQCAVVTVLLALRRKPAEMPVLLLNPR
mmetsp:Transcript_99177/g.265219  ORF Transcript_99177/g.265219 Transcript_99177/m.265219 type:complete len:244 (-) Transcript_99177:2336-3067(-)